MKVLVVDDYQIFRRMVLNMLPKNLSPIEAENGEEGLRQLEANPDIGLVLCDVNMPIMDGITMVESIKAKGTYTGPIVMLTSEREGRIREHAEEIGIDGWLTKPFKKDKLLSTLKEVIPQAISG